VASLDAVVDLVAGRFGRVEPRRRVSAYLRGLLAGLERKNGWVRHEAPSDRVGVRDRHHRVVAAAW
jgi:hypothetical protein